MVEAGVPGYEAVGVAGHLSCQPERRKPIIDKLNAADHQGAGSAQT